MLIVQHESMNTYPPSPVILLIQKAMRAKSVSRRELGHAFAEGRSRNKAFRRLDELLRGERLVPEVVQEVAELLHIPAEQLAVAWESHEQREHEKSTERSRREMEEVMARRGPHLWGRLPANYHPSLITILGPEFFLLARLPQEYSELAHYEMIEAVGEAVRERYQKQRRCRLIGYEFRQSPRDVFLFDTSGRYIKRVGRLAHEGKSSIHVGNREFGKLRILIS